MTKKNDELLNSNYDGIQEYDNDLPVWWQVLFYITIAYGLFYVCYFHIFTDFSSEKELAAKLAVITKDQKQAEKMVAQIGEDQLLALVKDPAKIALGKTVYDTRCLACHGTVGQGLVGPNLTDQYWIHGGNLKDIKNIIEIGVVEKGMLAWKGLITDDEVNAVTVYIHSLQGTNAENPKAAEGEKHPG